MKDHLASRLMFTAVGLFTAVSPYVADWNQTHIYNPLWTPHAKFHNAQTMLFGAALGVLAVVYAWGRRLDARQAVTAGLLGGLYWLTQALSITFPGTALMDPEPRGLQMPVVLGVQVTQLHMDAVLLAVIGVAVALVVRKPGAAPSTANAA
jgi:hypothetical protein